MNILTPVQKLAGKMLGKGPEIKDMKVRSARLSKCYTCPHLLIATKQCKKCLCFVEEKIKYRDEKCKIGKW